MPGEVFHETGRVYAKALLGCLEAVIPDFRREFEVASAPQKLEFKLPSERRFSYDASGTLRTHGQTFEVMIELKGYANGTNLLPQYELFLKNSFLVAATSPRNREDLFWFVTNVPFGSSIGRQLTSWERILSQLQSDVETRDLAEPQRVREFASNVSVVIFTDSFMKRLPLCYVVEADDTLWEITRKMSGGQVPLDMFAPYVREVGALNRIDPDQLFPGQQIKIRWFGMPEAAAET
jgi:nucleoid-associated protein YgaU